MSDATYGPKVYHQQGGDVQVVASGVEIKVETGGKITANGTQAAAPTTQLASITHSAPTTPDYALQDLVQNTGFGFATKDEGNSLLAVVANLQTRVAELQAALAGVGIVA